MGRGEFARNAENTRFVGAFLHRGNSVYRPASAKNNHFDNRPYDFAVVKIAPSAAPAHLADERGREGVPRSQ